MLRVLILALLLAMSHGRHLQSKGFALKQASKSSKVSDRNNEVEVIAQTQSSESLKGLACIIGGAFAHLAFGSFYCWGNFISYSPLNLRFYDGKYRSGPADSLIVMPLSLLAQCLSMPLGAILVKTIGASSTLLIAGLVFSSGVFLASFAKSLATFLFCYSFLIGGGIGIGYTAPMTAGWKWLPQSKGLVSGAILTGFGTGGFIFNLIGTKLVNPKGLDTIDGKFPAEVYANFPSMLRKLSAMYFALCFVGSLLVVEPKVPTATVAEKKAAAAAVPGVDILQAVKTPQFALMWVMIFSSVASGLNVASIYKQFASTSKALAGIPPLKT
jgi:hypothetical protein